ncbi:NAD(P)H-dependent oxidoreductase [Viscerimonas tarda]
MTTLVLAHPWHGSFNKAILDTITAKLDKQGKEYQVIDLNKDQFNPVMTEEELALYSAGGYLDPLVGKYQAILSQSAEMIFIFPIWWGTAPAILKGFFDKVLLKDFAFSYENGWTPLLKINKTTVITTSESPTEHFRLSIENNFIPLMLYSAGISNATWLNCDNTSNGTDEHRQEFLRKVEEGI